MEVSGHNHAPAALVRGSVCCTNWIGGWMGPRAELDVVAKRKNPCPYRESNTGCPARS